MKCLCGKDSIISVVDGFQTIDVCQHHYEISCIKDIETNKNINDVCEKCSNGLLLFDSLGEIDENTILVTFICSRCNVRFTGKRRIEDYFR